MELAAAEPQKQIPVIPSRGRQEPRADFFIQDARYTMVVSRAHLEEVNAISDAEERREVMAVLGKLGTTAECDLTAARARAVDLRSRKFGIADAAHVALAEATADFFITCDDRLVRKCKKERVVITAMNPVEFAITENLK